MKKYLSRNITTSIFTALMTLLFVVSVTFATSTPGKLININPDVNGDPWFVGGVVVPTKEKINAVPKLSLASPTEPTDLPTYVDNSTKKFFRGVFSQEGGSCAQASAIGYVYTYEMNWLKNTDAKQLANQYPSGYTYNFINSGSGMMGSWMSTGWDIIKDNGIPSSDNYGGTLGGNQYLAYSNPSYGTNFTRWMSGYDKYSSGNKNSSDSYFTISMNDQTGLNNAKAYLVNHATGNANGGILSFVAGISGAESATISDTYQNGKQYIRYWSGSVDHSMTIVGYDDNIRVDYNGDGIYTNNIDINSDGIVNLKDYEIGAFIFVNSWGDSWGNSGFCYLPYRLCALTLDEKGVYEHMAWGVKPKIAEPKLSIKLKMNHSNRNNIVIRIGTNANVNATSYTQNITKSGYWYGGEYTMLGESSPGVMDTNPISMTLDATELLSVIDETKDFKMFLEIEEYDSNNVQSGSIQYVSIVDNRSGSPVETIINNSTKPINNNTKTTFGVILRTLLATNNLALNKPITFSSQQAGNEALKIVDGDTSTNWSADTYPEWVTVDLGTLYNINKTEILPLNDRAYKYKIETSTDGTTFTTAVNKTSNTVGNSVLTDTFTPVKARYIKLTVTGCSGYTGTWTALKEFRVYKADGIDSLPVGGTLEVNQYLQSPNGQYRFILQTDGNLVIYDLFNAVKWTPSVAGAGGKKLKLQSDGNLVLYTATNTSIWDSKSNGKGATLLKLNNNGSLVLYNASNLAVWYVNSPTLYTLTVNSGTTTGSYGSGTDVTITANTPPSGKIFDKWVINSGSPTLGHIYSTSTKLTMPASAVTVTATYKTSTNALLVNGTLQPGQYLQSPNGQYRFILQTDGNLVIYNSSNAVKWSPNVSGAGGEILKLQSDGNLVLRNSANVSVWSSKTNGIGATSLKINDDGSLVLYNSSKVAVWKLYTLTINSGTGTLNNIAVTQNCAPGTAVTITANEAASGMIFDKWVINAGTPAIANINALSTTLTMPSATTTVTATYKTNTP